MNRKTKSKRKPIPPKTILRLAGPRSRKVCGPHSLAPMLNAGTGMRSTSLSIGIARSPRLSFSKTVIVHYRMHLELRKLAPGTINLRLGAVRRLAYESADCGLLSADLAAGIRRVKCFKKLGARIGKGLPAGQSQALCSGSESAQG
jgi:hypothetical protein